MQCKRCGIDFKPALFLRDATHDELPQYCMRCEVEIAKGISESIYPTDACEEVA